MSNGIPPTFMWIALPNGREQNRFFMSVLLSPRLYGEQERTVGDFDYLKDWPGVLKDVDFFIQFNNQPERKADVTSLAPDASNYWSEVFSGSVIVRPYEFRDYSLKTWHSFSVRETLKYVKELYKQAGLGSPFSLLPFGSEGDILHQLNKELGPRSQQFPEFLKLREFYGHDLEQFAIKLPEFEFHELVSALGDHPAAMRKLGLLVDLTYNGEPPPSSGKVRVSLHWNSAASAPRNLCPWTHYISGGPYFEPARRSGGPSRGYFRLQQVDDSLLDSDPSYDLVQVDADGAALQLLNLADVRQTMHEYMPFEKPRSEGLPALRTAGITLTCAGRAEALKNKLAALATSNPDVEQGAQDQLEFYAEELLRGYRLDILDKEDPEAMWRSLCQRTGQIRFPGTGLANLDVTDEGYVKSATSSSPRPGSDEVYLHEAMFRWDGWSVVVERPGLASASATERLDRSAQAAHPRFPFEAHYSVPEKTLPKLRFGHTYRLRARLVDLGGNSLPFDPADSPPGSTFGTKPLTYWRFEPAAPPVLIPRARFKGGEALERLVIRSNWNKSAETWAADHPGYSETCERHVMPAKASVNLAETHGALDPWLKQDVEKAYYIALREAGSLRSDQIVDLQSGKTIPSGAKIVIVNQDAPGEYVVHQEEQLVLPYLPDPAIAGAGIWQFAEVPGDRPSEWHWAGFDELVENLPAEMAELLRGFWTVRTPYGVDPNGSSVSWPLAWPFRVVVREAPPGIEPGSFGWKPDARELTVFMQKASVLSVRYSSLPDKESLSQMGIWQWLTEKPDPDHNIEDVSALAGLLWMLTPYRELTFVHAVQQPLVEPTFTDGFSKPVPPVVIKNNRGDTYVNIKTGVLQNTASTSQVELLAHWSDPLDEPARGSPLDAGGHQKMRDHDEQVLKFAVDLQVHNELAIGDPSYPICLPQLPEVRHELGDTKHHWVYYSLRGTTRYREYFEANPHNKDTQPQQYLEYELNEHTRTCTPARIDVLNSTRPPAPQVPYVVPIFGWTEEQLLDGGFRRTRNGGGLRVYLERPWYASGPDELLGVILMPEHGRADEYAEDPITKFGLDPIWASKVVDANLSQDDFLVPTGSEIARGPMKRDELYSLPDSPRVFKVAGYPVQYNRDQDRWYADLLIRPDKIKAYYPFLRLALARYQPHSLGDAHLSAAVLADPIQLVPTRILTFQRKGIDATLCIEGYQPVVRDGQATQHTELVIGAQTFDVGLHAPGDPLGWKPYPEAQIAPTNLPRPASGDSDYVAGVSDDPNYMIYKMRFKLPLAIPNRPAVPMRLVIEEHEKFDWDGSSPGDEQRRLVYADTIDIIK